MPTTESKAIRHPATRVGRSRTSGSTAPADPASDASIDAALLARCRDRDAGAFGELVERYKDAMVNYLTRLTGCRDQAEDFAQETFLRLYQNLDRYRDQGHLTAYLYRIATNLVRSQERRKRRFDWLRPYLSGNGHHDHTPQADVLASERQRQVSEAIASLDLLYRAPLVLREIDGLSYLEISRALDCSEGTVKSRLHRGRQLLKKKLAAFWNERVS